jgi:uroporphyrinogen III methyltransferase / synthase
MSQSKKGPVYLVGAGPGDPGLLTLKAQRCIEKGDVIIYDNLANRIFLEYARENAERIYVGKEGGRHTLGQDKINALIVEKALQGLTVVRLKGGDPFIFGRGGEEAQVLVKAGIAFEVIPGVTSAIAVPAYAGIPLTHREHASTVAFITGHEDPTKETSDIAWDKLATGAGTLVFLMGVGNLEKIALRLMENGRGPETPVAVIRMGTVPEQRSMTGRLQDIAEIAVREKIRAPAVIVVGEVVRLHKELNWFEEKPLFGKKIIVTRAREQASEFLYALSEMGAQCLEFPTIKIIPPESWEGLEKSIRDIETYQWLIFTSVNGVKYFFDRLEVLGRDVRDLKGVKIAAIGPATAEAVRSKGLRIDLVPEEYRAESVIEAFRKEDIRGKRFLLPRAREAREILPQDLVKLGAVVDVVEAYRTVKPEEDREAIMGMLKRGDVHMVTFTSSSTVSNFVGMFQGAPLLDWMEEVAVACIGPVTAKGAEETGLKVSLVAPEYTIPSLTKAIVDFFSPSQS